MFEQTYGPSAGQSIETVRFPWSSTSLGILKAQLWRHFRRSYLSSSCKSTCSGRRVRLSISPRSRFDRGNQANVGTLIKQLDGHDYSESGIWGRSG